ncbi:MAG: hypothetical protein ACOCSF_00930 [Halanaeroarchaeum sp.]
MNAPRLGTILLVGVLVAGVAFVGPALAHGDETTTPTNETANETHWNDGANTWTDHANAGDDRSVPAWMASHTSQGDGDWMASAMGVGTQDRPATHHHQQTWNGSKEQSHTQQYDDRPGATTGGHHGHDW